MKKFAEKLPFVGIIAPGVMITKDGCLLRVFHVDPRDLAFKSDSEIALVNRNINYSFRGMEDGWSIYIDTIRNRNSKSYSCSKEFMTKSLVKFEEDLDSNIGESFDNNIYVSFLYSLKQDDKKNNFLFQNSGSNINHELKEFIDKTDDVLEIYKNLFNSAYALDDEGLLSYLHSTFSNHQIVRVPEIPFYLDVYLADKKFITDTVLKLDDEYVGVISFTQDWPSETRAKMVSDILEHLNFEARFTTRFIFLSKDKTRKEIKDIRKAHFQKRKSIGAILGEAVTKEQSSLEDTEALALTTDASEALSALASGHINFGYISSTITLRSRSQKTLQDRIKRIKGMISDFGFITKTETINGADAFLGTIPGNLKNNFRRFPVSTNNLSHFFPISGFWKGNFRNSHLANISGVNYPLMVTRSGSNTFYFNIHVGQVGHTLIIGPTGAGKSILLNTICLRSMRYKNSKVIFFDKEKSSQWPCLNSGGLFYDIANDESESNIKFNPFWGLDNITHRNWLSDFLSQLFRERGLIINPEKENEILNALTSMSSSKDQWSWKGFNLTIQDKEIREACISFTTGEFSDLFTDKKDDFSLSRWVTFEMHTLMQRNAVVVRFILGYLFHKIDLMLEIDGDPTIIAIDEAWLFLSHPFFQEFIKNWLKTLRKKNAAVILATQELADAKNSPVFSTIVNACLTKILLPNDAAKQSDNAELYRDLQLTERDIDVLVSAKPQSDYFYLSELGKQLFTLGLTKNQLEILKKDLRGVLV